MLDHWTLRCFDDSQGSIKKNTVFAEQFTIDLPPFFFSFSLSANGFPGTDLKVTGIDFLKSRNSGLHHTDAYNIKNLVVRRGQAFQLRLSFSRELKGADKLVLHFGIGKQVPPLWPSGKVGEPQQPPAACSCCQALRGCYRPV